MYNEGQYETSAFQPIQVPAFPFIALPDARNTLLWAPSVVTNEKGEASLSFFCSDINSAFIIQAEGLTKAGLLGTQKLEFIVTKGKPIMGNK